MNLDLPPSGDEIGFLSIARSFLEYNSVDSQSFFLTRSPLSPAILIPPFKIFGYSLIVARFVNIFISSLIVPLLFIILKDGLNCNNKQSFFISLFYSIYPPAIFYSSLILSENLAALLTLLVFYYTLKVLKSNKYSKIILLGLNLALLSLTRSSNYYLIFFIIFGILVFENKKPKFYYQKFATMLIVFYMTMSPLIIYNQITFGRFLPTEPRLGYGLYLSNNDLENSSIKAGGYFRDEYLITSSKVKMNAKELIERDDLLKAKALDEIFSNPQNLILPIINRFINFWTFRPNPIKNNITTNDYIMFLVWVPILIFYGYSFFVVKEKKYLYLDLFIIYSCLTILPFFGMPRFRFPIDSLIMIKAFECGKIIYNNRFKS